MNTDNQQSTTNNRSAPLHGLPKNFVVIDCETSGLDARRHSILSIGAVRADGAEFYLECRPWNGAAFDEGAMAVNGFAWLDCLRAESAEGTAVKGLGDWLRGAHDGVWIMGGKNPQFDFGFLSAALVRRYGADRVKELLPVSRRCVDLHSLAYWWAIKRGIDFGAPGFSTDIIYAHLGFQAEPRPHHALIGARLEMQVFQKLMGKCPSSLVLGPSSADKRQVTATP